MCHRSVISQGSVPCSLSSVCDGDCTLQLLSEHIWCQVRTSANSATFTITGADRQPVHPKLLNIGHRIPISGYLTALCAAAAATWTRILRCLCTGDRTLTVCEMGPNSPHPL